MQYFLILIILCMGGGGYYEYTTLQQQLSVLQAALPKSTRKDALVAQR